jgi:plasmid stabilization system protein ParE
MTRASWSPQARADLRALTLYLKARSPAVARVASNDLFMKADQLIRVPGMGRPGAISGTFERSIPKWHLIMVYRVTDGKVEISALQDTRREKRSEIK